ncbi:hypothetical protein BpHYR1_031280 [Brachionus plicatilis]|uniref:Uncharacterized protein n=1 Tax=Brachionus plicatilis TaxID=10195 RepID=A0A3M7R861_BRAPC|nr:hypothetical protein BpHYR1_031280 [Brachionus plicatilis]
MNKIELNVNWYVYKQRPKYMLLDDRIKCMLGQYRKENLEDTYINTIAYLYIELKLDTEKTNE